MHIDTFKLNANGLYVPFVRDEDGQLVQVAVAPMDGAQEAFLCAPEKEVGLAGNRGGGKTEVMGLSFLSGVGRGFGPNYRGVLIRRSQREFTDLINLTEGMIRPIWPKAQYNKLKNFWEWPTGEMLEFSYFDTPDQFGLYQGKSFVWIGFQELTLWPTLECYFLTFSTLRSPVPEELLPRKVRFTCNPSGPGHNAVRHRFNLSGIPEGIAGPVIIEVGKDGVPASRRMIFASFEDNVLLKRTEPEYMRAIEVACEGDPAKLQAWKYGNWSVISGGAFDGIFFEHAKTIYVEPFFELPASGKLYMSYDHGSTKPYACLFWWESDGSDIQFKNGRTRSTRPGDLFLVGEVYGSTGRPNERTRESIAEITTKIQSYKIARGWRYRDLLSQKCIDLFKRGFADNAIGEELNEFSVAVEFERPVRINGETHPGIRWELVSKPPGSRVTGFALMRERLIGTAPRPDSRIREAPGLFVVKDNCPNFVRTIPVLPRSSKNPDDVNSESEDHIFDAVKYMLQADRSPHMTTSRRQVW
jgi:hypothetical protein